MKPLKLTDISPQEAEFFLAQTQKTYRLRRISLHDEAWLDETFGPDKLQEILEKVLMREVCRIAFHQMHDEDKRDFIAKDVKIVDEDGNEEDIKLGGAKLLFALVSGYQEKLEIYKALLKTIGISQPILEEIENSQAEKKRQLEAIMNEGITGMNSSTSSPQSTVGRRSTSSPVHVGKSISGSKRSGTARKSR